MPDSSPPSSIAPPYVFFDAAEARFIEAACQRLIPADSVGGGALGADVPRYLDAQLAGAWGAGTRPYRDGPWQPGTSSDARSLMFEPAALFRSAIRALTRDSRVPFEQLPADAQDDYLRSLESGRRELGVPSAAFFAMLLAMTVEGFLSHPLHGSTRDKVAWRVQGFAGAHAAVPSMQSQKDPPTGYGLGVGSRPAPATLGFTRAPFAFRGILGVAAAMAFAVPMAQAASPFAAESTDGMVVSAQHVASDVGAAILRQGGNAIDAAVAVGYALAVTHPCCGNVGGGGFMTIHLADGKNTFINFREKAPLAATADMYLDRRGKPIPGKSLDGYLAVGVPGTVLGLEAAREHYGTLPRAALLSPAIRLAEDGFILTRGDVDILAAATDEFRSEANVAAVFLNHGIPFKPGERLRQPALAATLRIISDGGAQAFYHGPIAAAVAAESKARGGLLTAEDFAAYTVTESPPVMCPYRNYTIVSAPPPSSGGVTLCEMLRIVAGYPLGALGYHSSQSVHYLIEAMRYGYFDRNRYLGDPAFVVNPVERLLSEANAAAIRARIAANQATPSASLGGGAGPPEHATTTHYSVVDRAGNAVSVTYTINDDFGAKVIAGNTGFFLNDEMDDFTSKPGTPNVFGLVQGKTNGIAPGKRPLSSMTPTIVLRDGKPVLVVGAPGGSRIITTVLEIIVNVIDHGMTLQEAIDAPRIHHQWLPDTVAAEPFALSADTSTALSRMGYRIVPLEVWGTANAAEAIGIAPADETLAKKLGFPRPGVLYGAADSRAPAGAAASP